MREYGGSGYNRRTFLKAVAVGATGVAAGCEGHFMGPVEMGRRFIDITGDIMGAVYKTAKGAFMLIGKGTEDSTREQGQLLEDRVDDSNHYSSIKVYASGNVGNKQYVDEIVNNIADYLSNHCVAGTGKEFKATFITIQPEAIERARQEEGKQYGPHKLSFAQVQGEIDAIVMGPKELYNTSNDTAKWLANYAQSSGGVLAEVTRKYGGVEKPTLAIKLTDLTSKG